MQALRDSVFDSPHSPCVVMVEGMCCRARAVKQSCLSVNARNFVAAPCYFEFRGFDLADLTCVLSAGKMLDCPR